MRGKTTKSAHLRPCVLFCSTLPPHHTHVNILARKGDGFPFWGKCQNTTGRICQNGVLPLPKSVTPSRIVQNTEVFDFEITAEDMAEIAATPLLGYSGFVPEEAPADALVAAAE